MLNGFLFKVILQVRRLAYFCIFTSTVSEEILCVFSWIVKAGKNEKPKSSINPQEKYYSSSWSESSHMLAWK